MGRGIEVFKNYELYMIFYLLQIDSPTVLSEAVSETGASFPMVFIALISYLVCAIIQYVLSVLLKQRDVKNDRQIKIADLTLKKEIELFTKLDHLRTFQKEENHALLSEIESIQELLSQNRLMYRKDLYNIADEITDYFAILCKDYSKKDLKKEIKLLDKYRDRFYSK